MAARASGIIVASGTVVLFVGALVAAEALLRVADPHYLDRTRGVVVYSPDYGWSLHSDFQADLHGCWTTVNAAGYRGRLHARTKMPGHTRIVMLGDSIAFGVRVTDDQTLGALLEAHDPRLEVVNLAVEGYGTDQELIRLEDEGLSYHPDVVVLHFALTNDVENNVLSSHDEDERMPKPFFSLEGTTLVRHDQHLRRSRWQRFAQWLADESHLHRRLAGFLPVSHPFGASPGRNATVAMRLGRAAFELTLGLIRRFAEEAKGAGARVLVLLHPDEPAFHQRSRVLRMFCETPQLGGVPIVDLGEQYRARGLTFSQVAQDYQGHLTIVGHQAVSAIITTLLAEPESARHRVACRDKSAVPSDDTSG